MVKNMSRKSPDSTGTQSYGSRKARSPRKAAAVAPHESPALNGTANGSIKGSPASATTSLKKQPRGSPSPRKTRSVLSSPRKRSDRRKYAKHRRGVSFADEHNRDLTEIHEIERRANARSSKKASGCCVVQ